MPDPHLTPADLAYLSKMAMRAKANGGPVVLTADDAMALVEMARDAADLWRENAQLGAKHAPRWAKRKLIIEAQKASMDAVADAEAIRAERARKAVDRYQGRNDALDESGD